LQYYLSRSRHLQGGLKTQARHLLSRLPLNPRHLRPARQRPSPPQKRHPRTLHIAATTDTITRNILARFRSSGRITAAIDTIGRDFTGRGSTGLSPIGTTTIGTTGITTSGLAWLILSADRFDRHASSGAN
jgi:hypothetical protein